jgi:hypothetical protein
MLCRIANQHTLLVAAHQRGVNRNSKLSSLPELERNIVVSDLGLGKALVRATLIE